MSLQLKLKIELVPSPLWYRNLRKSIGQYKWRKKKKEFYETFGHTCQICGSEQKSLQLHEKWNYDDEKHIQSLKGLIHLCKPCHMVKHPGHWGTRDGQEKMEGMGITWEDVIEHFCKVNECSITTYEKHYEEMSKLFEERSNHEWTQNKESWKRIFSEKVVNKHLHKGVNEETNKLDKWL